ncbi:acyl carrier protein [Algibacillus agarilyticus]|uniref:acyl carrier protein n=1 Tax=Algibacillus agarilyticus TaxID=2234133 RepID=UPI000DD0D164|nr:acyl carrier protein [Algibacillus agarilyticus]
MNTVINQVAPTLDIVKTKASELLAERLRIDVIEVDMNKKLTSYGLDSIDAVTMIGDLEDWLDIELPSTLLWDYDTINDVAQFIVENFESLVD